MDSRNAACRRMEHDPVLPPGRLAANHEPAITQFSCH